MSYVPALREIAVEAAQCRAPASLGTTGLGSPSPSPTRDVGRRARALFAGLALWRRAPRPRLERCYWYSLKPLFAAALILWYTPRHALAVRRSFGVSIAAQLAQQCRLGFRDWVNPRNYYFHEHYRRFGSVDCDAYVMRHEIKEGLLKALHKQRPKPHGERVNLGHKLAFARIAERYGLPVAPIVAVAARGRVSIRDAAALDRDLFIKPEHGRGAIGAQPFRRTESGDFALDGGTVLSPAGLLKTVARRSRFRPQILQPLLRNHPDLADLADRSLITLRIFTCFAPADAAQGGERPVVTHAMLRTIGKLEPGWHTTEEFAAPIDLVTGRLGVMCGDSAIGPDAWYEFHPVTGARVTGRIVPQWPAIRALAVAAHRVFADRMILGWDIALTPDGPVLIEANSYPDTEFLQRVHRQGIGDSPLGPLLALHLDRLAALGGGFEN